MMHGIIEIIDHLNQFENNDRLIEIVVPMKSKFIKYWGNIPFLYYYAFILDLRAKLNGFTIAIQILSGILNRDYSAHFQNVKIELALLFSNHESKYCGIRLQRPAQPNQGGGKVSSWNRYCLVYLLLLLLLLHLHLLLLLSLLHLHYLRVLNYKHI
jgi:hypothetical protein